jgi:hypothetical protein
MGREAAFNMLETCLHGMRETFTGLHTTVVADLPLQQIGAAQDTPALVDIFGNSAEDLIGWTMEALAVIQESRAAARGGDFDALRRGLAACHERTTNIAQRLVTDLLLYERIADLARLGRTRGGEWRSWATSVKQALDSCRQPLFDLQQAQFECWQEVAEHGGRHSIAVHATSVGTIAGHSDSGIVPRASHRGEL